MIRWLAVEERRIDVRRTHTDGHGGYLVGTLTARRVVAVLDAPDRAAAQRLAPRGTSVLSVPSLRVHDPEGWLTMRVGDVHITEELRMRSEAARALVAARRQAVATGGLRAVA